MSYQSDIVAAILADAPLSEAIGGRVFADIADGTASPPYLVYQSVSTGGQTTFDGGRTIIFPLVQFSIWAHRKTECIAIAQKLKTAIEGKNLPGDSNTSLGFSNQISTRDQQTKLFGEMVDYRVSCNI